MCGKHEETKHLGIIFFNDISYGKEIACRFRHLLIINIQKSIVHPVSCKGLAVCCLRLGNLIFMMGEDQILAACMDINFLAQILLAHYGALNMPAGTALAPWRYPVGLSFLLGLPENEIQRILLLILSGYQKRTVAAS